MSLRSPLSRVLGSGSAKDGTGHWWAQRATAVALALLGLWFLWSLTDIGSFGYLEVLRWAGQPWNGIMLILLCGTLAWHSTLGLQVVIEDYVHGPLLKIVSQLANRFAHVFVAISAIFAVLRISFGGAP
jgi:succinate dehydrogenase / fumarate reductase membrane anchor subunit